MGLSPGKDRCLLHRNESRQVLDLQPVVPAILQSTEIEKLGTFVNLCPEAMLQGLLDLTQLLALREAIKVCEDTDDSRKTVDLQDVDELEGLQLEPLGGIDKEQHHVRHLGKVQH